MRLPRALAALAAVVFAAFEIAAYLVRRSGSSDGALDWVGGLLAIAFILAAAVVWLRWRSAVGGPRRAARAFLLESPAVAEAVGAPVDVRAVVVRREAGGAEATATVRGATGEGTAELRVAENVGGWAVEGGSLRVGGVRIGLSPGTS